MKLSEAFSTIRKGINLKISRYNTPSNNIDIFTFNKNAIEYGTLVKSRFESIMVSDNIEGSFLLQALDIIISTKKPYKAAISFDDYSEKVVVGSNFIILRGLNKEKYLESFVVNYLNQIGINKIVEENNIDGDLSKLNIEDIELPNVSKEKQLKYETLMMSLNKRCSTYLELLENDKVIIEKVVEKVVGDDFYE